MRYRFDQIFQLNQDGSISPRMQINISGVTLGPGVAFGSGVAFGGVNFFNFRGNDIEADQEGEVLKIKGFYPN